MRKISLLKDTPIWTLESGPVTVSEMTRPYTVYSPFGKPSRIHVTESEEPEQIYLAALDTGQQIGFGASHQFLARNYKDPAMRNVNIASIAENSMIYMLPMPTRKAFLFPDEERQKASHELLMMSVDNYSEDEDAPKDVRSLIYLSVEDANDMWQKATWAGFYGMAVRMKPANMAIELDEGRPSCYSMKLLINQGIDDMVNALIDKQVLRPAMPYENFLAMAKKTGCLFEGYGAGDLRTILGVLATGQYEKTWTVHCDDPSTTIELAFMRT